MIVCSIVVVVVVVVAAIACIGFRVITVHVCHI